MELCGQRPFSLPVFFILGVALIWILKGILRSHQLTSDLPILPVMSEIAPTTSIAPDDGSRYLPGFQVGGNGQCLNVDDCQLYPDFCKSQQECLNTIGSFRCVVWSVCPNGYISDPVSGKQCIDIDECRIYLGTKYNSICGQNRRCENTVGSFRCLCNAGFINVANVDECQQTPGLCTHGCINTWGSYICSCEPGYRFNSNNGSCDDIDECEEFKKNNLCSDICVNTPGSYTCSCPAGYKVGPDGRTCEDVDECPSNCHEYSEICQNFRGSFRCIKIVCPDGYYRYDFRENKCTSARLGRSEIDLAIMHEPSYIYLEYVSVPRMLPIPTTGRPELFTLRGMHRPDLPNSSVQFSMALVDVRAPPSVVRATENCFSLTRSERSEAVLLLTRTIAGPQEIELEILMEIYKNTTFLRSEVTKLAIFVDY